MKNKKYITMKWMAVCFFALWLPSFVYSQDRSNQDKMVSFDDFKKERDKRFSDYVKNVDADFSEYTERMRKAWEAFVVKDAEKMPFMPKPQRPVHRNKGEKLSSKLPSVMPRDNEKHIPPLPNLKPIDIRPIPEEEYYEFDFYNTKCAVAMGEEYEFSLDQIDEEHCADAWEELSKIDEVPLINSCATLKSTMNLGDWGYIELTKTLAESYYQNNNEATLFWYYLLSHSGYDARIGRSGSQLQLFVPFRDMIFNYKYVYINGSSFYNLSCGKKNSNNVTNECYIFNMPIKGTRVASVLQVGSPIFDYKPSEGRVINTYGKKITLSTNKNLVDFLNDYPIHRHWEYYSAASLDSVTKETLYQLLREITIGLSTQDAVNRLLHFVQYVFNYKTDHDQFGEERPLFGEESFFYPYNDCEDRAILFSHIVKEMFGLEAVLVLYPGHLSSAVKFPDNITGSYYIVDGEKYYSCDPTYIGASIGEIMPQFVDTKAEIIKIGPFIVE